MERRFRSNPYENTKLFGGNMSSSTVCHRLEGLAQHEQLMGHARATLRDAFYGENAKSFLVLDYDLLAQAPQKVIPLLYEFICEPYFENNFDALAYDAPDFDLQLGLAGLHWVKPKLEFTEQRKTIPTDYLISKLNRVFGLPLVAVLPMLSHLNPTPIQTPTKVNHEQKPN